MRREKTYRFNEQSILRQLIIASVFAIGIHITVGSTPVMCKTSDRNPPLTNIKDLIEDLPGPWAVKIEKTKPPAKIIEQYSAIWDHSQGITMIRGHWVIAHSMGNNIPLPDIATNANHGLLFVQGPRKKSSFHLIGSSTKRDRGPFPHCGGIQACGDILAVAVEPRYFDGKHWGQGSEVVFLDMSTPHAPVELPVRIDREEDLAGAVGIAYHATHKCHYVVVQYGQGVIYTRATAFA